MTDLCSSKDCGRYGMFCFEIRGKLYRACSLHRAAADAALVESKRAEK